jgi:hypothetical protein
MLVVQAPSVVADPARATASAKHSSRVEDVVLVGTITDVVQRDHEATEMEGWSITVAVDRVLSGRFSGPTLTFAIHSPGRAGLNVGKSCTIKARRTDKGYVAVEPHPPCP